MITKAGESIPLNALEVKLLRDALSAVTNELETVIAEERNQVKRLGIVSYHSNLLLFMP